MTSTQFYANLPPHSDFLAVTKRENFTPLPDDWHVIMSDVRDSTVAVQSGDYKNVNILGASTITAVLNAAGAVEIPFVFEGDGSVLCVPPEFLDGAREALLQTRELARKSFGLDLRIATLPVAQISKAGWPILVARYKVSENYIQAVFTGGGIAHADRYMKDPATAALCTVNAGKLQPRGSFEGLECRWQDIPSPHGETVSVMVRVLAQDGEISGRGYREVIEKVREVYGDDRDAHPVAQVNLALTFDGRRLAREASVRAMDSGPLGRWFYVMKLRAQLVAGWLMMRYGVRTGATDWGRYKETAVRNTDIRKFNDLYRQIVAGTAQQRQTLTAWLDERYARGELVYGMHVTDRAHMTCIIFDYAGRHLHFVDGADGGLFLAAKDLKQRVASRTIT